MLNFTCRVVDVFALLCHLLDIDLPKEIDADMSRISHLLKVNKNQDIENMYQKSYAVFKLIFLHW